MRYIDEVPEHCTCRKYLSLCYTRATRYIGNVPRKCTCRILCLLWWMWITLQLEENLLPVDMTDLFASSHTMEATLEKSITQNACKEYLPPVSVETLHISSQEVMTWMLESGRYAAPLHLKLVNFFWLEQITRMTSFSLWRWHWSYFVLVSFPLSCSFYTSLQNSSSLKVISILDSLYYVSVRNTYEALLRY